MKYYLIVGEASGDLHASRLMHSLKAADAKAEFRFFGGDLMAAEGGTMVKHYRELAYMGFIPVLLHLPTIMKNMRKCKQDIVEWAPDVLILVDYPGFNLDIAKFVKKKTHIPVYYYISPKIWAWKEYRIKNIKRDVDELFSILPFEVDFFEGKHHYPIHYVGNPTMSEVAEFRAGYEDSFEAFCEKNGLQKGKPVMALLAGSRRQEIKDNLPMMIRVANEFRDYQLVLAGAPGIDDAYYESILSSVTKVRKTKKKSKIQSLDPYSPKCSVHVIKNQTYALLTFAHAALVTSGTATLETALFRVPQVVCYKTPLPRFIGYMRKKVLKVKYISLVNLIAGREVVKELVADSFTFTNILYELSCILEGPDRERMQAGYDEVARILGDKQAPDETARKMIQLLKK